MRLAAAHAERPLDVLASLGPRLRESLADGVEAFHLKPNVVDAAPRFSSLDAGCGVVLEVEDCQVDVAVGEEAAAGSRIVDLADLLHAEHLDVEPGRPFHVLGRERDVLDLGHESLLCVKTDAEDAQIVSDIVWGRYGAGSSVK